MKRSSYFIIMITELIVIFVLLIFLFTPNNIKTQISNEPEIINTVPMSNIDTTQNIYEEYEDLSYNYIKNPEKLSNYSFLGVGITTFGDTVNQYVKSLGYEGQQLFITSTSQDSSYISVDLKIGETSTGINVTYDNLLNEYVFKEIKQEPQ